MVRLLFKVKVFELKEFFFDLYIGWKNLKFGLIFLIFHLLYLFSNPYRISRKLYQIKGIKNVYQYGETPLSTFQKICKEMDLKKEDLFLDLGCGRGLPLMWLSTEKKIHCLGIDFQKQFIQKARLLRRLSFLSNITFVHSDFSEIDFSNFTAIYFYGITFDSKLQNFLTQKFEGLMEGAKVLTISSPIDSDLFFTKKTFPVFFNWGKTTAFLNIKKNHRMCTMRKKERSDGPYYRTQ